MSKFRTVIPVDTKAILAKLPRGSYVHEIKMTPEKDGVEVIWDNDLIIARFQQIDFPPECFDGELPADVVRVIGMEKKPVALDPGELSPVTVAAVAAEQLPESAGVGNSDVAPKPAKRKK